MDRQPIRIRVRRSPVTDRTSPRTGEPITVGAPLPSGFAFDESHLAVERNGTRVPLQARVLDRWADGSIRWVLLDFQAHVDGDHETPFLLTSSSGPLTPSRAVVVRHRGRSLIVETGAATFIVREGGQFPLHQVIVDGTSAIDRKGVRLEIESGKDRRCQTSVDSVAVEHEGPLRTVVRITGSVREPGQPSMLVLVARLHFFAGLADVRVALTLQNPRAARHRGGLWDLGDPGSVFVKDVSVRVTLPPTDAPPVAQCSAASDEALGPLPIPFQLYQDSSGGEQWDSANHVNRHGVVPNTFRGFRLRSPSRDLRGHRATPIVTLARGPHTLAVGMEHFWQNFPKTIDADSRSVRLGLFPSEYADVHEIQGGEQKTHVFMLGFGLDRISGGTFEWWRHPLSASLAPADYVASGAVGYITPADHDPNALYVRLVNEALDGHNNFDRKREVIDEYGWRHFGDIYGDHEAVRQTGGPPLISHYNNQYDAVAGFAAQFMRTGDTRWWRHMRELAAHVVDIDIYHTTRDKAAYNHGLFWHTCHYTDAGRATHRSYPSGAGVPGGGPSSEHNYAHGLMLCYFLTGDDALREAALGLAQFAIDMDDGTNNMLGWVYSGRTGLATASGSFDYHGPGRGAANSLEVLVTGAQLSGDDGFLEKAEEIVRRCVHPLDDIARHNLLDAERKWFYTMFLQALGRYLDVKVDRGSLDEMYAYGRAALLHYARWMARHEYPYLDKPDILQFPTETWAAQDMRKSEVFKYAAKHATGEERAMFWERAEFFFRYSTEKLAAMPTHTLARPMVLLLSFGYMHAFFQHRPETSAPEPQWVGAFPEQPVFVRQKVVVKRRAVSMALLSLVFLVVLALG